MTTPLTLQTRWTKGPWTVHHQEGVSRIAGKTKLADVYSEAFRDTENQKSNANVMHAAPDLYDALLRLANESAGFLGMASAEDHGYTNIRVLHDMIIEARLALAKARGEK